MRQEENRLKELEARQKLIPFVPSATSYGMSWKALQAVRYCNLPDSVEYSSPPVSLHRLVLTIRPPKKSYLQCEELKRDKPLTPGSIAVLPRETFMRHRWQGGWEMLVVYLEPSIVAQVVVPHERSGVERARVDHLARGDHAHVDLRLAAREIRKARHQPAGGEDRRRSDLEIGFIGAHMDRLDGGGERIEALAQARQRGARRFRELHAAARALEELHAEVVLEALDLVAHGGLRDRELVRRLLEGEMARRGLEYPQCVQRRKSIDHDEFFLCEK